MPRVSLRTILDFLVMFPTRDMTRKALGINVVAPILIEIMAFTLASIPLLQRGYYGMACCIVLLQAAVMHAYLCYRMHQDNTGYLRNRSWHRTPPCPEHEELLLTSAIMGAPLAWFVVTTLIVPMSMGICALLVRDLPALT
jgi:hypothetical protein